ncbi:MAG TPA: beta-ketoacyl synthase N-terminal-like domain-containing protein [Bryobacteraceae bacterium]|nr:beta-ketoacyl synthase N-terminal-like domain-containing protein [Bryobacteraceae bacterium]
MSQAHDDIAIIGLACVFPGARNAQRFWENIIQKVDAVSDPPPDWEAEFFFDPENKTNDRTYCKRGGYLGPLAEFNPMEYGVMPNAVDGTEPDHFMALRAASEALADAGYGDPAKLTDLRRRTAVIIGRGTYVNRGNTTAIQHSVVLDSVLRVLRQLHPEHTDADLAEIRKALKSTLPPFHADTAPGLVPNIISGRIANRLDLMGPNYIVDAACASSLIAVDLAIHDLHGGRCDMALAGGVHASTPPTILAIFSQLKALSRKGQIRPFDRDADGTLLGEGVGMVVLKRLADAERAGDRVYAVIKGIGSASDGRALGLLAPRLEGEELALRRAYEDAGFDPATVELIEAHGTATAVGDVVELQALNNVFGLRRGDTPRCALGSVKSMISHTMPASGMASLIKTTLALHHKVLPPTLHCENPNPKLELEKSDFYLNTETRPWIHGSRQAPRRAGVNAFGFGGINAHTVLEEYTGPHSPPAFQHTWDSEMFVVSGATRPDMLQEAERLRDFVSSYSGDLALKDLAWTLNHKEPQASRLAIVAASREDLQQKLERAIEKLRDERTKRIRAIEGIYYFSQPLAAAGAGKVAFVFPGEGAQYTNMLADLCVHFPEVREFFDLMDRAFEGHPRGYLPSTTIFPPPDPQAPPAGEGRLFSMDAGAEAVFAANQAMYALIEKLGIPADAMVGHSTGEHSALLAAGVVRADTEEELIRHIRGVNGVFEDLKNSADIPQGILLAVAGADHALLEKLVAESDGQLHIALDNCPHQVVLCGPEPAIDGMMQALAGKAAICQKLPFARAYHTPWFEVFSEPLRRYFDTAAIVKPNVALYSCVTAAPYPADPDEIRRLCSVGWARTVRFRETVQALHQDGVRIFVEVGPRGNLTGFIDDILRSKPYAAVPANLQHRSGILQLQHMLAQLVAHGVPVRLEHLYARRDPQPIQQTKPKPALTISGGLHPVRLPQNFALPRRTPPAAPVPAAETAASAPARKPAPELAAPPSPPPVIQQHFQTMTQFLETQNQVMGAYLARRKSPPPPAAKPAASAPAPAPAAPPFPFITEVLELTPGLRARTRHRFSLDRERLFTHHTLGRNISKEDPELSGLPVVPLTVFMEILAEAGALLEPGKALVGMRDFRAYRWITLEQADVTIELTAERREGPGAVYVTMRESGADQADASRVRPIWAEGLMLFAPQYPQPAPPQPFILENERHSRWTPDRLYVEGMFHGPTFQAVKTIERTGDNGTVSIMEVLPRNAMFAGVPEPLFLTDPVVLDAAGQVVAFWSQEQLDPTGDIFPYRLTTLDCYGPPPAPRACVECRVHVTHVSDKEIHSDIEILDATGRLLYRIGKWEDRRFPQSPEFWQLRIAPQESCLSSLWNEPIAALRREPHGPLVCCRLDGFTREFFEASHGIWLKVLAHLTLSRREREQWMSMRAVDKRRHEWLLGRCAAKDAVRMLLEKHLHVQLSPADVEIVPDAYGRPQAQGAWTKRLGVQPAISISHSEGVAVALAALHPGQLVGIDLESSRQSLEGVEATAFSPEERHMLDAVSQDLRQEWALRMWCAKEAIAKALGRGLSAGLHAFQITAAEMDTGVVHVELRNGAVDQFPSLRGRRMIAYTARETDFVFSTVIYQQGAAQ